MAVHIKALLEATELLLPNEVENRTCLICYEDYLCDPSREYPRKLSCGHVIGTECLLLWASSQTHATSTNCPWCRRRIVDPIYTQGLHAKVFAYAEAALQLFAAQIERAVIAVDRVHSEWPWSSLHLAVVLNMVGQYFGTCIARLPFAVLLMFAGTVFQRRLLA